MASEKQAPTGAAQPQSSAFSLPFLYRLFFLLIEPISALVGAYYAYFDKQTYLSLTTHSASAPHTPAIPLGTSIVLSQLANLYLFFALNEALVLRSTSDIRVWKTVLFCLLIGDIGHLYSVRELGINIYWSPTAWNAIDWGNIGFVYLGAAMRVAFLADVGLYKSGKRLQKKRTA